LAQRHKTILNFKTMNYSLPEPNYSHDPRNHSGDLHECLNCKDSHDDLYDDFFCSKDCCDNYSELQVYMILEMLDAINWEVNHLLRLDQMLYNKAIQAGEVELAQEIAIQAKQNNFKIVE
jgi:hypothetical protein